MANLRVVTALAALLTATACGGKGGGGAAFPPPTGLTVTYIAANTVHLTWTNPPASGTTAVQVERATASGGPFSTVQTTATATATTQDDAGLVPGTRYFYRVRLISTATVGASSNVATADPPPLVAAPTAPTGLTPTVLSDTSIKIDWAHPGTNVKGFRVERLMNFVGYDFVQVADLPDTARTFTDTCLRPGSPFRYRVSTYNQAGETASASIAPNTFTNAASGAPAAGPSNMRAVQLNATSYRIEWDNACSTADRIFVEFEAPIGVGTFANVVTGQTCSTSVSSGCFMSDASDFIYVDLPQNSSYRLRASAGNALGFSGLSNTVDVFGPVVAPPPSGGSIGVYADYDNMRIYSDLAESTTNGVHATGGLAAGCFWSFNTFLGIQDFMCYSSAIHFPLSGTTFNLAGKTIDKALLVLYTSDVSINPTNLQLEAIASSWNTNSLNGATSLNIYNAGASVQGSPTNYGPYAFDVTTIVQNWASGAATNNGVLIEDAEYVFPYNDLIRTNFFYSTDSFGGYQQARPTLWVDFH